MCTERCGSIKAKTERACDERIRHRAYIVERIAQVVNLGREDGRGTKSGIAPDLISFNAMV